MHTFHGKTSGKGLEMTHAALNWMAKGGCSSPEGQQLPWLADGTDTTRREDRQMSEVCQSCPVLRECVAFVQSQGIVGGFWAGQHRESSRRPRLRTTAAPTLPFPDSAA